VADFTGTTPTPSASLVAATATGAGATFDTGTIVATGVIQTIVTGSPSAVSCTLQASLNGSTWVTVATSTSTTGDFQYAVDKPARYFRANLGTLTGGTAPTVTAWVGGC
jgi:hypothetical protein